MARPSAPDVVAVILSGGAVLLAVQGSLPAMVIAAIAAVYIGIHIGNRNAAAAAALLDEPLPPPYTGLPDDEVEDVGEPS